MTLCTAIITFKTNDFPVPYAIYRFYSVDYNSDQLRYNGTGFPSFFTDSFQLVLASLSEHQKKNPWQFGEFYIM